MTSQGALASPPGSCSYRILQTGEQRLGAQGSGERRPRADLSRARTGRGLPEAWVPPASMGPGQSLGLRRELGPRVLKVGSHGRPGVVGKDPERAGFQVQPTLPAGSGGQCPGQGLKGVSWTQKRRSGAQGGHGVPGCGWVGRPGGRLLCPCRACGPFADWRLAHGLCGLRGALPTTCEALASFQRLWVRAPKACLGQPDTEPR